MGAETMKNSTIEKDVFTYYDSEAGKQTEKFGSLEEIKKYINNLDGVGDSDGTVYKNGTPVLEYANIEGEKIVWRKL